METEKKKTNINLRYPLDRLPRKAKKLINKELLNSQFAEVPNRSRFSFWFYSIKRKFGLINKDGTRKMILVK